MRAYGHKMLVTMAGLSKGYGNVRKHKCKYVKKTVYHPKGKKSVHCPICYPNVTINKKRARKDNNVYRLR